MKYRLLNYFGEELDVVIHESSKMLFKEMLGWTEDEWKVFTKKI